MTSAGYQRSSAILRWRRLAPTPESLLNAQVIARRDCNGYRLEKNLV